MICLAYQTPAGCPGNCNMLHVCYAKGCQGKHPYYKCPKAKHPPDSSADAAQAAAAGQ